MLTRQNAEPLLGMKLTLFLSGHRNCGISRGGLALSGTHTEDREKTVRISQKTESALRTPYQSHTLSCHHFKDQQMQRETKTNVGKRENADKQGIRRSTDCVSSVKTLTRSQPSGGSRLNM